MESFYQESGRSGRDGKRSECIVLYRLADIFKLSPMVFSNQTGLPNLYGMVEYCLDSQRCRRRIIASHFDEGWDSTQCSEMCDFCLRINKSSATNIVQYCRDCYKILQHSSGLDTQLTAQKLIDAWLHKGPVNLRVSSLKPPSINREQAEDIIALLLIKGYLKEDFHFTAYSTISYLKRGPQAASALRDGFEISVVLPYRIKFNLDENAPKSMENKIAEHKDLNNSNIKKEKCMEAKPSSSKNDFDYQRKKSSLKKVVKEESSSKRKLSNVICLSSDEGSDVEKKVKKKKIKILDSSDSETDNKKKENFCS